MTADAPDVRPARRADLPAIVGLIHQHIAFERADPATAELTTRLEHELFDASPARLLCFVAATAAGPVGYLTCTPAVSTWAGEFLHMDCLFVRADHRGAGLGRAFLDAAHGLAVELGIGAVQWQTPAWNEDAIRFYDRSGAASRPKRRYTLTTGRAAGPRR